MAEGDDRDLNSALDLFVGDTKQPKDSPKAEKGSASTKQNTARSRPRRQNRKKTRADNTPKTQSVQEGQKEPLTTGWVGRLPGHRRKNQRPKAKTTIRIDAELVNEYRERVFIERRPLGELIEHAMREHKERNW